jgi:HSP20 family protein
MSELPPNPWEQLQRDFQEAKLPAFPGREPTFELFNQEDALLLKASLPGFKPEDLEISLRQDSITITGQVAEERHLDKEDFWQQEQKRSAFIRTISFPQNIDPDRVEVKMEAGTLSLIMPKLLEPKARTIKFKPEAEGKFLH